MNRIAARSTDLTERNRYFQSWYFNRTESHTFPSCMHPWTPWWPREGFRGLVYNLVNVSNRANRQHLTFEYVESRGDRSANSIAPSCLKTR